MLPAPRIVAIDDEPKHLDGLTRGLNTYGVACLPIHFTGETESVCECPHVRVIFADLHLNDGSATDHARDFSTIGGLIEDTLKPSGPYFIILWTKYPEQADKLCDFLTNRLKDDVAKPFVVQALDKNDHLDGAGNVKSIEELIKAVRELVATQPQIQALFNWEERVTDAGADTVSSILELAKSETQVQDHTKTLGKLLANFAVAAVGKEHVEEDRFRAVNEALLPILADRIASMRSREVDNEQWEAAFDETDVGQNLSQDKAAKLNKLIHVALSTSDKDGSERGDVLSLPKEFSGDMFESTFNIKEAMAAEKQFWRKNNQKDHNGDLWVLVQTQAACDYAQKQPGPSPFYLGLLLPADQVRKNRPPAALWRSPHFVCNNENCFLHVNARFQVSLPSANVKKAKFLFRLREQLLNDLIYWIHSYGARPGIISFP